MQITSNKAYPYSAGVCVRPDNMRPARARDTVKRECIGLVTTVKELIERVGHGKVFVEGVQNNFGTNKVVVSVEFDAPTGRCCVGGDLKDPADLRELLIALVRKLDITPCEEEEMLERFDQNLLKDRATAVIDEEGQLKPVRLRE